MDALDLLRRYADIPNTTRRYDASENVPILGVVPDGWLEAVVDADGVIERASNELCVIVSLKDALRRRETHHGEPRWHIPDLGRLKVPENLRALHTEVAARWGIIDLLEFLKESDFVTDFTDAFTTVATREATPREVIRKRLLLVLYALGTNVGIKRVADGGRHGETEAAPQPDRLRRKTV
ncbi:hypothetical protein GCM10010404_18950 [Nonomuraea africana]|uniref:Tn3 transposase DDE domain-containing protein n=1 Tax=Nonomuraea africana TaxID=46171 RepID=A0ABR9KMI5_9ACTN|nr:Tn3 family transposase [Nonomuraea africana]MBE1562767.1 hypothetical protein [Nonomuraea africana]